MRIRVGLGPQTVERIAHPTIPTSWELEAVRRDLLSTAEADCPFCGGVPPWRPDGSGWWCCRRLLSRWLRVCHGYTGPIEDRWERFT